jgi:hypothetical protein
MSLYDLLKEGIAIQYDRKDGVMMVWIPDRTVRTLTRVVELLGECFGVDPGEVEVHPTIVKTAHRLRLEFPYSFDGHVSTEDDPRGVTTRGSHCDHTPGTEGCDHTELQEAVPTSLPEGWYRLTDRVCYRVERDEIVIAHQKDGSISTIKRLRLEDLDKLYRRLPEETDIVKLREVAKDLDLDLRGVEHYVLHLFSNYVRYGGELLKVGRKRVLIKDSTYLREENRRKLRQEMQVIGKPWEV